MQSAAVLVIKSHTPKKTWTSQLHQLERGGMRVRKRAKLYRDKGVD